MSHGGKRQGAGRPPQTGLYKEPTVAKRLPISIIPFIDKILEKKKSIVAAATNLSHEVIDQTIEDLFWPVLSKKPRPLFSHSVSAGFPSPADDHMDKALDLNDYLISRPASTFFVRVSGDSMINAGIHPNDILVVDRSIDPQNNSIVIAVVNGELTVKRLQRTPQKVSLIPENPDYPVMDITEDIDFFIWGVVTSVIHQFKL